MVRTLSKTIRVVADISCVTVMPVTLKMLIETMTPINAAEKKGKNYQIFTLEKLICNCTIFFSQIVIVIIYKGQVISKRFFLARILPKNERMNSFKLVCDVFSFVFWENPRP